MVAQTVEQAFAIFACLADRGMVDIVYPKPLARAAVKQVAASTESALRERAPTVSRVAAAADPCDLAWRR